MNYNNEIHLLRLAVITKCNLSCKYCFVKKDNRVIRLDCAEKAVRLLLNSPGREKILIIYGGEPLLVFNKVKKIVNFSIQQAKSLRKSLVISLGTNGILLNSDYLSFFNKSAVKLAISIDGQEKFHDKNRVFINKKGSFSSILKQIPLIMKSVKNENLSILFGVLPESAENMFDNLIFLNRLGFNSINIEPIQSNKVKWAATHKISFSENLNRYLVYMLKNIVKKRFFYLNSINRELGNRRLSSFKKNCPFYQNLEVYPGGEMAFSAFLINSKEKHKFLVGNIKNGFTPRFDSCSYAPDNKPCRNCWSQYRRENIESENFLSSNDALKFRNNSSVYFASQLQKASIKHKIFKQYINEAKKRIFE